MKTVIQKILSELKKGCSVMLEIPGDGRMLLDGLCTATEASNAVNFMGRQRGVYLKSEYTPPYKEFNELKKLILRTNDAKGLRRDFHGIVMLDISDWLAHECEDYFSILLKFIYDKREHWKCIFVVNSNSARKKEQMYNAILKILRCGLVVDGMYELETTKKIINHAALDLKVKVLPLAEAILCKLQSKGQWNEQETENIVTDIICESGTDILDKCHVMEYFKRPTCMYRNYYITENEERGFNRE